MQDCGAFSDKDIGGFSTSNLTWHPFETKNILVRNDSRGYARFHGHISTALPPDRLQVQRSGYAAWRTKDRGASLFGSGVWNIDPYVYLALRVKSDGRSYLVNIQTESIVPTDIHQHRLFAKRPGQWETVFIRLSDFVRTNYGRAIDPANEMLTQKVTTVGIGLTDRVEGDFELCIGSIWAAMSKTKDNAAAVVGPTSEGEVEQGLGASGLRSKSGERVHWGSAPSTETEEEFAENEMSEQPSSSAREPLQEGVVNRSARKPLKERIKKYDEMNRELEARREESQNKWRGGGREE